MNETTSTPTDTSSEQPVNNQPAAPTQSFKLLPRHHRIIKTRTALLLIIIVIAALVAGALYWQANRSEDASSPKQSSADTTQEASTSVTALTSNLDGVYFDTPNGWSLVRNVTGSGTTYDIYSPEVTGIYMGYEKVASGMVISVFATDRMTEQEAGLDNPLKAYLSGIGAPKIDDDTVSYEERQIDWSKVTFFERNNIEFMTYPWAWEGCTLNLHFLGEKTAYFMTIVDARKRTGTADGCPTPNLLTDDADLAAIVNSISLGNQDTVSGADGVLTITADELGTNRYEMRTKNLSFEFATSVKYTGGGAVVSGAVPKLNTDGSLQSILLGIRRQDIVDQYTCDGCGSSHEVYDGIMTYTVGTANTNGLDSLAPAVYGSTTSATAVQSGATANTFTLIRQLENGYFTLRYTTETLGDTPASTITDGGAVDVMSSLTLL